MDPDNTIAELNESNNSGGKSLTVSQLPGPDLVVQGISWSPNTPQAGRSAVGLFSATIANQGLDATGSSVTVKVAVDATTTLTGVASAPFARAPPPWST